MRSTQLCMIIVLWAKRSQFNALFCASFVRGMARAGAGTCATTDGLAEFGDVKELKMVE